MFVFIKIKYDSRDILKRVEESYNTKKARYYNFNSNDRNLIKGIEVNEVVFAEYDIEECVTSIFIGKFDINEKKNMSYKIYAKIESELVIKSFIITLGIDLHKDFKDYSYLTLETSDRTLERLKNSININNDLQKNASKNRIYLKFDYENNLNKLAQRNEYINRAIGSLESDKRGEFQRDRERIVHAKSSRRLVDKAQIFTSTKGDHYRTRMTHTIEVSQIARGICRNLRLNEDLTEAIALAHDIGHTPFGHQGERTINDIIVKGRDYIPNCNELGLTGFKHNLQGVRVLSYLEECYTDFDGLDLSYQVLEGVLKHTGGNFKVCSECNNCKNKCFNISEYLLNGDYNKLYLDYKAPTTLEGQIVKVADEIAQRGHDIDDALSSKHIDIDELIEACSIKKMTKIKKILDEVKKSVDDTSLNNRILIDKDGIIRKRLVSNIIRYFMSDVIDTSKNSINSFDITDSFFTEEKRLKEQLIVFSEEGEFALEYLERLINKKVINSFDVSRFDSKASMIIEALFKAYYKNLIMLPTSTLKRIYIDMKRELDNVIDFRDSDTNLIREEILKICHRDLNDMSNRDEYKKKRRILIRNIADHISGMTDNYAIQEYNRIYN